MADQMVAATAITIVSLWLILATVNWMFDGCKQNFLRYLSVSDTPWFLTSFLGFFSYVLSGLGVFAMLTWFVYLLIFC